MDQRTALKVLVTPRASPEPLGSIGGVVLTLTRDEARRIAVRAQLLDAPRPTDLVDTVRRLTLLQIDPTAAVAPNADLVLWSRLGSSYRAEHLTQAIEETALLRARRRDPADVRPAALPARRWPGRRSRARPAVAGGQRSVPARTSSPCCGRRVRCSPATCPTPARCPGSRPAGPAIATSRRCWRSCRCGGVAIVRRQGRQRVWDLAERVYPAACRGDRSG